MRKSMVFILSLAVWVLMPLVVSAEVIHLKSGKVIDGKIVNRTTEYIEVDFDGTPIKYYLDEVDTVDAPVTGGTPPAEAPLAPVVNTATEQPPAASQLNAPAALPAASVEEQAAFGQTLTEALQQATAEGWTKPAVMMAKDKLDQFIKDHPQSLFVKDAEFLGVYLLFNMSLDEKGGKEESLRLADQIGEIASRYPDGSLEDLTCQKIRVFSPEEIFIPFKFARNYMRAWVSGRNNDYEAVLTELFVVRQGFNLTKDNERPFIIDVYERLFEAYKMLNKQIPRRILDQVLEKYPDLPWSEEFKKQLDIEKGLPKREKQKK